MRSCIGLIMYAAPLVPSRWTEFFKGWNANTTRMHARDYHGPEGPVAEAEGWLASKDGKSARAPVCLSPPRHASRLGPALRLARRLALFTPPQISPGSRYRCG